MITEGEPLASAASDDKPTVIKDDVPRLDTELPAYLFLRRAITTDDLVYYIGGSHEDLFLVEELQRQGLTLYASLQRCADGTAHYIPVPLLRIDEKATTRRQAILHAAARKIDSPPTQT